MLKIKDSNVTVMVSDMDKSIDFYQKIGLTLKQRWDNHYAMVTASGITLGIHPKKNDIEANTQISIGFMVDDINEPKAVLEENNIEHQYFDSKEGLYLNFRDPDGTYLYFTQPKWEYGK
jgi:predicted enzyme related to lactoylglutathione lyase